MDVTPLEPKARVRVQGAISSGEAVADNEQRTYGCKESNRRQAMAIEGRRHSIGGRSVDASEGQRLGPPPSYIAGVVDQAVCPAEYKDINTLASNG